MGKKENDVTDKLQKVAAAKPKKKPVSALTVFIAIMGVVAAIVGARVPRDLHHPLTRVTAAFAFFAPAQDKKQETITDLVGLGKKTEALLDQGDREAAVQVMRSAIAFATSNARDFPEFHFNLAVVRTPS